VNTFSGSVARLDLRTGEQLALLPLRGEPTDVVLSRDGKRAFVSLAQLDEVAVLDLPQLTLRARVPVGDRPRAMALTPDGRTLLVANFQGGDVSLIDTETQRETRRVALSGINLRGIDVTPDGRHAFVTGQVPASTRVTWVAMDVWVNSVFRLDLQSGAEGAGTQGRIDFINAPAPDPDGIVALGDERVAVAVGGNDEALLIRTPAGSGAYYDPVVERRARVGAHPRGMALSRDGKQLWVANELGSSISILDATTLNPTRRIVLDAPAKPDARLPGRYLFGNAGMTAGRQFTCNSCHPEGGADGLTWEFVHVPDGIPARNTRNVRGGVTHTAPFRWSGRETDVEVFIQDEITGLLHGSRQSPERLHALRSMVEQFPMPPNPHRAQDGNHTAAAERGKTLFEGKAGCVSCHVGDLRGGTGVKASIGTTLATQSLDVPHLAGAHDSAPYLHDGRAKNLEAVFSRWNPDKKHGKAHELTKEELADVLRYVREL
ncbi:MAG TPA: beta-propeller fold lactonase family protein, partial [Armatimonadota bacterium]|nr:beta-propeller fold lactonase family protein [Armatimonadota bacterium]